MLVCVRACVCVGGGVVVCIRNVRVRVCVFLFCVLRTVRVFVSEGVCMCM